MADQFITLVGSINSKKTLLPIRIVIKETGQKATVEMVISYQLTGLANQNEEQEYTLVIQVGKEKPVERSITLPAAD
ncbi:MAG: hypothetical protein KDE46_27430, partial [Caldilineaceae bacterium]|nr:hypothetical protein [Caldilineaceae bacterium]